MSVYQLSASGTQDDTPRRRPMHAGNAAGGTSISRPGAEIFANVDIVDCNLRVVIKLL